MGLFNKCVQQVHGLRVSRHDDADDCTSIHGESSGYEEDFADDPLELAKLAAKEPETGDFALIKLTPVNSKTGSIMLVK